MNRTFEIAAQLLTASSAALLALSIAAVPTQIVRGDEPITCNPAADECPAGMTCVNGICIEGGPQYIVCRKRGHRECDCWFTGNEPEIGGYCGRKDYGDTDSSFGCLESSCRCWRSGGPQSPLVCTTPSQQS